MGGGGNRRDIKSLFIYKKVEAGIGKGPLNTTTASKTQSCSHIGKEMGGESHAGCSKAASTECRILQTAG